MTDSSGPNPFLPLEGLTYSGIPPMELAAQKFIKVLHDNGLLKAEHVLSVQLVLDLSRSIGLSAEKGRASGMALASRELREVMAALPSMASETGLDEFTTAIREFMDQQEDAAV